MTERLSRLAELLPAYVDRHRTLLLTDILVLQFVSQSDSLRLMLDGFAVDNGSLEHFNNTSVNGIAL